MANVETFIENMKDPATLKAVMEAARQQGEAAGRAAVAAEADAVRAAEETARRAEAQRVVDAHAAIHGQNPFRAAQWMQTNARAYVEAQRVLRGGK